MLDSHIKFLNQHRFWHQHENIHYTGIFNCEFLENQLSKVSIQELKKNLNGSYAIVIKDEEKIIIITDPFRSIPIYYQIINNSVLISDSIDMLEYAPIKNIKQMEYLNSGFIFGTETLKEGIFQATCNSVTTIDLYTGETKIKNFYSDKLNYSNEEEIFSEISDSIAKDLLLKFSDYSVYVPLSDGTDSKYIISLIQKSGLKNVICYTYGVNKDDQYVQASKSIADNFGYKWEFVQYTSLKWKNLRKSKEFKEYLNFSFQYSSFVHVQDFIAVWELTSRLSEYEKKKSIFIPGHTGTIGGGNLPSTILNNVDDIDVIKDFIKEKDFNLWNNGEKLLNENCYLSEFFESISDINQEYLVKKIQHFDLSERQSKLIVNSVRVYEYFGVQWYLPLSDVKLVSFFEGKNPLAILDKKMYKELVSNYFISQGGRQISNVEKSIKIKKIKKMRLYYFIWKIKEQLSHEFGWFSMFTIKERLLVILKGNVKANTFMSLMVKLTLEEGLIKNDK